jgi:hypothetical protein
MANPSLHAALHNAPTTKNTVAQANPIAGPIRDTKKLIVEIPSEAHYQIDKMRLDMRRNSIKELVTESLNDLFKKHGYPPIA